MGYWYPELYPDERKREEARILMMVASLPDQVIDWSSAVRRGDGSQIDLESKMLVMREIADQLDPPNLAAMLQAWWSGCDGAWRFGTAKAVGWFRRAGPIDNGGFPWPVEQFPAWRGTMTDTTAARRGLSWTLKPDRAFWFATKDPIEHLDGPGYIWETDVSPDAVLATFNHIGEHEVIVDPTLLGEIRLFRSVPRRRASGLEQGWREDFVRKRAIRLADRTIPV